MSDVIALIFDFDDTLASDSTSGFLGSIGVDTASFWKDQVDPLLTHHDWDPVPAYLYKMIQLSQTASTARSRSSACVTGARGWNCTKAFPPCSRACARRCAPSIRRCSWSST